MFQPCAWVIISVSFLLDAINFAMLQLADIKNNIRESVICRAAEKFNLIEKWVFIERAKKLKIIDTTDKINTVIQSKHETQTKEM